jgi:hypothetical protein
MLRTLFLVLLCLNGTVGLGQYVMSPLNPQQTVLLKAHQAKSESSKPTGFAPYLVSSPQTDSILDADTKNWSRREYKSWVMKKIKNEHLFEIHTNDFMLQGDAVFNLEGSPAADPAGRKYYTNSRGFNFNGFIGKRIFFNTSFYETQSIFPNYLDSLVSKRGAYDNTADPERGSVPGYGRWKDNNTSSSYDYDYTLTTGTFGVMINENSFIQFGHDKQFVGYGYRSIFLADAASPYPFLRAQFSFWGNRITYTTTWALLQSLDKVTNAGTKGSEAPYKRLGGRFSYLSFQPAHWFSLGIFNGTTWRWRNNSHPVSAEYFSPLPLVYTGVGIKNQIAGINGQITLLKTVQFYGQFGVSYRNRSQAAQVGMNVFGPIKNLVIQLEYNKIGGSFYYSTQDSNNTVIINEPFQKGTNAFDYYQHNDQILGHPMGVPLDEMLLKVSYRIRDLFANISVHNTTQNLVSNPTHIRFVQAEGGYIFNPKSNAQLTAGIILRNQTSANTIGMNTNYPYIAFRTNLFNRYMDF